MMNTIDISGNFRGVFCDVHLPGDDGEPIIGGNPDANGFLAFRAFDDARLDDGPRVLVALAQDDAAAIMPLDLAQARTALKCLTEALAEAEKLQ